MTLRLSLVAASLLVLALGVSALTSGRAEGAIHEIVAAYCSGGDVGVINENGYLEPPPIEDMAGTTPSEGRAFAKPVLASGAVDVTAGPPPEVTDKPNAKFQEGTPVNAITAENADHPSAEHCPNNALP
jgi:hypothetical protein